MGGPKRDERYGLEVSRGIARGARSDGRMCHNAAPSVARTTRELPTRSRVVPALLRYVRKRGGNASGLIGWFQLPEDVEALDEVPIPVTAYGELLDAMAKDLREPFLGLRLPE